MSTFSTKISSGTGAKALPAPDANDTYDWAAVQAVRTKFGPNAGPAALLKATAGQALPVFTFILASFDEDSNPATLNVKVDASPKWFTFTNTELKEGKLNITLGTIAGKTTPTSRVVRVTSDTGPPGGGGGAGKTTEYFYAVS